jgi:hypothetical protein
MKRITTTFNFSDHFTVKSLPALLAIGAIALIPCSPRAAEAAFIGSLRVKIRCHPPIVYRGDDVVVDLDTPHPNFDFGIYVLYPLSNPKPSKLFLLTFEPGKNDRTPPVIPPRKFAAMRQITLNTATARGSASNWWQGDEVPRAVKPPRRIFTNSGSYEILLGLALGAEDTESDSCWVDYVNEEKRPGAQLPQNDVLTDLMRDTFRQWGCGFKMPQRRITCPTTTIYKGETLALDLVSKHPAGRIGIVDPDWNLFLLPAEKHAGQGAHPGLRIAAGSETARAYSYESAPDYLGRSVRVETKGGRVFTKTGWYIAMSVPGPLCDPGADVGACWIHYVDARAPR